MKKPPLAERIRSLRKEKRLTQQKLSKKSGITQGEISNYENGLSPSLRNLLRLCKALGCTPNDLLY